MNDKVAENIEEKEEASLEIDKAFVKEEARVLDPTLLKKPLLDRMPTPTGWRILVLPYRGKGVTEGGIQLVKETMDRESLSTVVAYVLKVGPLAYKETEKYGHRPWCQEIRIINDDDVIGTILDPDDIKSL